jgi:hypothetical protein
MNPLKKIGELNNKYERPIYTAMSIFMLLLAVVVWQVPDKGTIGYAIVGFCILSGTLAATVPYIK